MEAIFPLAYLINLFIKLSLDFTYLFIINIAEYFILLDATVNGLSPFHFHFSCVEMQLIFMY